MNRFQKWAAATTVATYALIMVGSLVRASGAGLGCPDWPKCFGRYYPPLNKSQVPDHIDADLFDFQLAWIEYTNRLLGVLVGFLILGTLYYAIKSHRQAPRVLYPVITAFILVLVQGWLGGQVVESGLKPALITAHLVLALIIVSLLLYATVSAFFPTVAPFQALPKQRRVLGWLALIVLGFTLVQAGIGASLRGELEIIEEDNPGLERGEWIEEAGWIDPVHRSFSWTILIGVVAINYYVQRHMKGDNRWLSWAAWSTAALVAVQIGAGIGMAYGAIPPPLQVIHVIAASLLIGALMAIYLLASRIPTHDNHNRQSDQQRAILSQSSV